MPKESLSVYLSAVDGISPVFASITDKTRALDKESQELVQTYEALQKANNGLIDRKVELQKELKAVNEEVKEARKNFNALGDEANSDAYEKALEKQQNLRDKIAGTTKALQENQRIYKDNIETIRKGSMSENSPTLSDVVAGLDIGKELSSLALTASDALAGSAFGSDMGGIVSSALSSAVTGAALGSAILPGAGTAIGAVVGGITGAVEGKIQQMSNKDDAFKEYYGGLYDDVKGRSGEMVEAGTSLASTRETNRISFTTLFDGNENRARSYLEDLIDMANSTPFLYDDLVSMSKTLATYGYNDSNILPLLQTIGDAGAALGMGTSDMSSVAQALGRMKSSDKATLEYLNVLNDRGIGAIGYLADAKGKSIGETYDMISRGKITGTEAVEIITAALSRDKEDGGYKGSMEEQSKTFAGISSTLEGLQQNLNALGGEGYNTLRQEGKEAEVTALKGDLGDAIGEINRIMGENQARKENLQEQYQREVLDTVLNGNQGELWSTFNKDQQFDLLSLRGEYVKAMERYQDGDTDAGAELESLYEQAEALGQAYFENSDFMQKLHDVEEDEITAIRDMTAGLNEATQAAYNVSQALSKGYGAVDMSPREYYTIDMRGKIKGVDLAFASVGSNSHAFGLDRVPYDEYPALLHRDERVLTASEARAQDAGQGTAPASLTITGNNFIGTPEEFADQIWEIIVRKLERAYTAAAPK